ncbi:MAG: arsenate reductase ArsC [Betaproteobacteria bacterium]|nr:arsenate reductase ArsC [Betaproteobacteria bacterium]
MDTKTYNVLFLCTGNSARSILAEGLMNKLGAPRFKAYSAGSFPKGQVNPHALATLAWLGLPATGYRSKDWEEFAQPDAPSLDFVFTLCDKTAGEVCPEWPGQPITAHWGVEDPAIPEESEAQAVRKFKDTALVLHRRIELFLSLPLEKLDRMSLLHEVKQIGTR